MRDLLIVGAGGLAREVAFLVADINRSSPEWNLLGYIDRDAASVGKQLGAYSVVGTDDYFADCERDLYVVIGIGGPLVIAEMADRLKQHPRLKFPNLIHPSVIRDVERVKFGEGNIVCAGNLFTTDISVGSFNVLNPGCTFGHDIVIGNCNAINPGVTVSGNVVIEDCCLLGAKATILQNRRVNTGATVGAGALVTKDVAAGVTVVGVPAKPLAK